MKTEVTIALLLFLCFPFSLSENWAQELAPPTNLSARPRNTISPSVEIRALQDKNPHVRAAAVAALAEIGPSGTEAIPALIAVLAKDPDASIRWYAAYALGQMPSTMAIPALIAALAKDPDASVRANSALALGSLRLEAKEEVPALITALTKDPDATVRSSSATTLGMLGPAAKGAVPALIAALAKDPDASVRANSASALDQLGPAGKGAVPALIAALAKDPDARVRANSAWALSMDPKGAVPALIAALAKDSDARVREGSAAAFCRMGPAKAAVTALIAALAKDPDARVRALSARALSMDPEAKGAASALIAALAKDPDTSVRLNAARGLAGLADAARDSKRTEMIEVLDQAEHVLEAGHFAIQAKQLRTDLDILRAFQPPWYRVVYAKVGKHPGVVGVLTAYTFLALVWFALLWISPLSLWGVNQKLVPLPRLELPGWLGGLEISVPTLILVGFFHYRPRVLDAWVTRRIVTARDQFRQIATVQQREVHVDVPVELDREVIPSLKPEDLKRAFGRSFTCLLLWGEGGSGKTSLACRIAGWAMSDEVALRPLVQRMLPVMIEQDLNLEVGRDRVVLTEVIRGQLRNLTGEGEAPHLELVRQLLRRKRVLLIVDGLSELNEATRNKVRPLDPEFPARALIVTSRLEESLDGVTKTVLHPLRIQGNRLSSFMEAYLTRCGKRALFNDAEFFDGCKHLSAMVGERDITVLLAKLYAEQMIAAKEGLGLENLPQNIPELMLEYLNQLNRKEAGLDDRTVHYVAKTIAWECLRHTYRPTPAEIDAVIETLGKGTAEEGMRYLEQKLRVLQVLGAGRERVKFTLDPLAEYLAGLYVVEHYRDNEKLWRDFFAGADRAPGAPNTIGGFLLALRDCCLAKGPELRVPAFVTEELAKRSGLDRDAKQRARFQLGTRDSASAES
jgi:HEAT repeat protein